MVFLFWQKNYPSSLDITFMDSNRTLTDEEVMNIFDNIIKKVTTSLDVKLRDK